MHGAVRVTGLLATPGRPAHVTGVRTDRGERAADLVVDATGRRSALDAWLADIHARPTVTHWAECGVAYYSRHYRLVAQRELPGLPTTRVVAHAQLRNAAPYDPVVFRAFWKVMGMVSHPDEIYTDPVVVTRTQDIIKRHGGGTPMASPSREQVASALST